jgi:hypothetical protein
MASSLFGWLPFGDGNASSSGAKGKDAAFGPVVKTAVAVATSRASSPVNAAGEAARQGAAAATHRVNTSELSPVGERYNPKGIAVKPVAALSWLSSEINVGHLKVPLWACMVAVGGVIWAFLRRK